MFWLYLLATVTILTIALRRVMQRQKPLTDEAFSRAVAFEHVHSGIAWIQNDGAVGSMNASFAGILGMEPKEAIGLNWYKLFAALDKPLLEQAYSRMLLAGKETVAVNGRNSFRHIEDAEGGQTGVSVRQPDLDLLMVAVHDHKMRFIGHHCLVADRRRERALEAQIRDLRGRLEVAERLAAKTQPTQQAQPVAAP